MVQLIVSGAVSVSFFTVDFNSTMVQLIGAAIIDELSDLNDFNSTMVQLIDYAGRFSIAV